VSGRLGWVVVLVCTCLGPGARASTDGASRLELKALTPGRPLTQAELRVRAPVRSTTLEPAYDTLQSDQVEGTPLLPVYELSLELTWKGKRLTRAFRSTEPRVHLRGAWEVPGGRCALVIVGVAARGLSSQYPDDVALAVCR
jgi:hypothetical protein